LTSSGHHFFRASATVLLAAVLGFPAVARAGGGPENVLLVVNPRSWASLTIANHFIRLRQLPAANVLYLDWPSNPEQTDVESFRQKLLTPIFAAIDERGLADHIDYIVYSCDFPWSVDARQELGPLKLQPYFDAVCSLTGVTYLWPLVQTRKPEFVAMDSNRYVRPQEPAPGVAATHGFHSWYGWGNDGMLLEAGGQHYMLSVMLGVTSGRGNSVAEVISYLERSAAADGTQPTGTIYYAHNADVRSVTRQLYVSDALRDLKALGVKAEVVQGQTPRLKQDVQGLMVGAADFDWQKAFSTILPGAICEHLTSTGGNLVESAGQTPFTEWLRHGAAGSSGAVVEPYAIAAKFPTPQIHVHYARGCSLAEAFYQSVAAPFQLLIVGDPLCRPWAKIPQLELSGIQPDATVHGNLELLPSVSDGSGSVDRFEWYMDARHMATSAPGKKVTLDTQRLVDGYHELRVVAATTDAIETQGRCIVPLVVDNEGQSIDLVASPADKVRWGEKLVLRINAPKASAAVVRHGTRVLGKVAGPAGTLSIDPQSLGAGPVTIDALAIGPDGSPICRSRPCELLIETAAPLEGFELPRDTVLVPGFKVTPAGGESKLLQATASNDWLTQVGVLPGQAFTLSGLLTPVRDELYQFQLSHTGALSLEVDDRLLYQTVASNLELHYVPVVLARGFHRLRIQGTAGNVVKLDLRYGTQGVRHVDGHMLQHVPAGGD
jgi:hypothetical protein